MRTFKSLLQHLLHPFKNFFNIFNKDFYKERRDLHFALSFAIVLLFLVVGDVVKELQIDQLPFWFILFIGWFMAYFINFVREWYYATKQNKFDFLDIYAGCYGGLVAAIIYVIC